MRTRRPQLGLWAKLLSQIGLVNTFLFFPIIGVLAYDFRSSLHMFPAGLRRWLVRVAGWIWWLYGVIPTVSALLVVRLVEIFESELNVAQADEDKIKRLEATEDASATNEVTLWFSVRPTLMRRVLLRLVLFGAERGSRFFWAQGRLAGIDTIHYARILQLDQGRTMAFLSDYGGGLNRYLDDFMSPESGRAVIPISSNLVDCPKTRWLFQKNDPATFDAQWKSLVRNYQIETSIWYSAYPLMTPREILSNSRLRDGLFAEVLSDSELKKWMRRL